MTIPVSGTFQQTRINSEQGHNVSECMNKQTKMSVCTQKNQEPLLVAMLVPAYF